MAENTPFKEKSTVLHVLMAVFAFVGLALLPAVLQLVKMFSH